MDTPQWTHQGAGLVSVMEELASANALLGTNATAGATSLSAQVTAAERKPRPHREQALHCPRCNSGNTKFCYYNNYSLTQPRYFCKACRRYWTQGGSLRNVPVGGGSRKNKKSPLSSSSSAAPSKPSPAVNIIPPPPSSRGFGAFMPIPSSDSEYPTGIGAQALVQEFSQPTLSFPLDVGSSGYGSFGAGVDQLMCGGGKKLLPFEDAKPAAVPSSIGIVGEQFEQNKRQVIGGDPPPVFWNGNYIIGGGSWLS